MSVKLESYEASGNLACLEITGAIECDYRVDRILNEAHQRSPDILLIDVTLSTSAGMLVLGLLQGALRRWHRHNVYWIDELKATEAFHFPPSLRDFFCFKDRDSALGVAKLWRDSRTDPTSTTFDARVVISTKPISFSAAGVDDPVPEPMRRVRTILRFKDLDGGGQLWWKMVEGYYRHRRAELLAFMTMMLSGGWNLADAYRVSGGTFVDLRAVVQRLRVR